MPTLECINLFNVLMRRICRMGVREYRTPRSKHVFSQHDHLCVLVFKSITHSSLRTLEMLAPLILGKPMDHSTPEKAMKRLGVQLFYKVLVECLPSVRGRIVAVDSTGFSTSKQSPYYTYKFFGHTPKNFVKVSLLVDTRTTAVLWAQIHILPRHDIRDVKKLLAHTRGAKHFVADKAYDAEWLHEMLEDIGITPHIPERKWNKRGFWRKKHRKTFKLKIQHQRALIETTNSVVKRRWGGTISAQKIFNIRIEVLLKLITHNLTLCVKKIFGYEIDIASISTTFINPFSLPFPFG